MEHLCSKDRIFVCSKHYRTINSKCFETSRSELSVSNSESSTFCLLTRIAARYFGGKNGFSFKLIPTVAFQCLSCNVATDERDPREDIVGAAPMLSQLIKLQFKRVYSAYRVFRKKMMKPYTNVFN